MKFFQNELIKNLPDCYNKEKGSNNHKIMQLIQYDEDNFSKVLQELWDALDLEKARGYTLDLYGDLASQKRGLATDEQYLFMIKAKMARNMCGGSHPAIVQCLSQILNCSPSEIWLRDSEEAECGVEVVDIPLGNILKADLTTDQFTQILKSLLPSGVSLESYDYSGTFEFSDVEFEASQDKGFCQNEGDDYGGYFGILNDDNTKTVLPI